MFTSVSELYVLLPNFMRVKIEGIGSIRLSKNIFLHNVLYIPTFRFNLLSLTTLISSNLFRFVMELNLFVLQDLHTQRKIGIDKLLQGILVLDFVSPTNIISSCNFVSYDVWHKCLGHIAASVYKIVSKKTHLANIDPSFHCDTCHLSKQNKLPFSSHNKFSPNYFDLVHANMWGPFKHATYNDCCYFPTIVDDKSRFTWVYLLKTKNDSLHLIPKILHMFKLSLTPLLKLFVWTMLQSYLSKNLFSIKGVLHQHSCVKKP